MMFLIIFKEHSEDLNSLHTGSKNFKLSTYVAEVPVKITEPTLHCTKKVIQSIHKNCRSLALLKYNLFLYFLPW